MISHVKFKKISKDAIIPSKSNEGDAGYDLYASENREIFPGDTVVVKTGIVMEMVGDLVHSPSRMAPIHYPVAMVCSRSGMAAKNSVFCLNAPGIIDYGYRGEICVILYNAKTSPFDFYSVKKGDRIAQLVFMLASNPEIVEVEELDSNTERGEGGFGSSGK
jgi:dUTP pyrophosphatase